MPNRLADEPSPYLRQHADNPVDWYPWGPAAFAAALDADRPVLLSVGYAACHWCHVMAHESFEDPAIAALMNRDFICVKVDREEHPEVDAIYQLVCQVVTGQGGWPLTVFLTTDLRPFHVGTYFPPTGRYGRPGFAEVLGGVAQAWRQDRAAVVEVATEWTEMVRRMDAARPATASAGPGPGALAAAADALLRDLDPLHGGFGGAPKFPNTPALEVLLRAGGRAAERAVFTLRCMAAGGIFDHLGGGFHRYSVDAAWQVPHFEKMLYDNACLTQVYVAAFQRTGAADLAAVARQSLDYLLRDLRSPEGAFYSTEDADSPGAAGHAEEGAFYTWTPEEVRAALGDDAAADLACRHFGITPHGNVEGGRSVLHLQGMSLEGQAATPVAAIAERLLRQRDLRARPARDEKVLTAWNGLAISAFAQAGRILGESPYTAAATEAAYFLLHRCTAPDGALLRRYHGHGPQGASGIAGTLEDYAYLAVGLIDLYEATLDPAWLAEAVRLARQAVRRFWEPEAAAFYLTERGNAHLIARPRDDGDSGTPSAQSYAVLALLRLRPYVEDTAFSDIPAAVLGRNAEALARHPRGMGSLLCALDWAAGEVLEVVIAAAEDDATAREWLQRLRSRHLPNLVLSRVPPGEPPADLAGAPAWRGRGREGGRPTLWVCRGTACLPPAHDWAGVEAALAPRV